MCAYIGHIGTSTKGASAGIFDSQLWKEGVTHKRYTFISWEAKVYLITSTHKKGFLTITRKTTLYYNPLFFKQAAQMNN